MSSIIQSLLVFALSVLFIVLALTKRVDDLENVLSETNHEGGS